MKSNKLFKDTGEVEDSKSRKAKEIRQKRNSKVWTFIALCLIVIIGGVLTYFYFINEGEYWNWNSAKVTKDFIPYGEGDFAISVRFNLDGYSYSFISEESKFDWNIDINADKEVCGEYLGEIQYGDYQAYRQMAGEEYKIFYGVYDKKDEIQQGVYDEEKGKTFSPNKNIVGGKVYQSTIADYILVVELEGKYALFVGNIATESDFPFKNAFKYYGINSGSDLDKIKVTIYDWQNGYAEVDENIVSKKSITKEEELDDFYEIVIGLKADRDNGHDFVVTREEYWKEQGERKTQSAKIELYLKTGYSIEIDYRQQYPYLLAFGDYIKVDEKYVKRFHEILDIE